jgi:photosystem II stability/assembly factor-like uncharacterized protein
MTRSRTLRTWIPAIILAFTVLAAAAQGDVELEAMRGDARLNDVTFVDRQHGWAVGDRGAIWHTDDGGRHWSLQNSGLESPLMSVTFLDANRGWAAGGHTQPYTHASTGVVLRTRDGGQHWTQDAKSVLPALTKIGFFDPTHGWALGRASAVFPSGVLTSDDGGRSWSSLPAADGHGWLTGDLIDPNTGAVAGRSSAMAMIRRRGIEPLPADFALRTLARMQLVAPAGGWMVGDGGLILQTADLGKTWQTSASDLSDSLRSTFDFMALAVRGPHVWVAGTPGTRVVHSADGGRQWTMADTHQTLPIRGLSFVDDQHGWAVGDLGVILVTADGGQSWQKQRAGGARVAFLGMYGRSSEIPLELLARLAAEEGYLGAIEIVSRDDVEARASEASDPALAAHEAAVVAGASSAATSWRFPIRQAAIRLSPEQVVELWDRANDANALAKLEAHLVARTRLWRPSVVFTSSSNSTGENPLAHVINQVVLRAVERAADPSHYPAQITEAGLQPWRVEKLYATLPSGQGGTSSINTAQLSARLGRSLAEHAGPARGVLASAFAPSSTTLGFRLLIDHIPQELGKRDFFAGIALPPGGEARRRYEEIPDGNLNTLKREAQLRRNLQAIMTSTAGGDGRDDRLMANLGEQTKTMRPDRAAELLDQLAQRYFASGRWELAAECYDAVVERYPNQPLAGPALIWLLQFHASAEAAWRIRAPQQIHVAQAVAAPRPKQQQDKIKAFNAARGVVEPEPGPPVAQAAHLERGQALVADARPGGSDHDTRVNAYAKELEQLQPALFAEPAVRFPLASAHRQQGLPRQAERYYLGQRHSRPHDAWWSCAQSELWLGEPKGQPPKELASCVRAQGKPRLDGQLNEPFWRTASALKMRSAQRDDADWRGVAMLAYDEEFLYLGIHCTEAAGFQYDKNEQPRPRDADLSDQDRVEILIDVDRDFATYYRLAIDHRGWTSESCWGDRSWNPEWFVASGSGDGAWTAEVAIPLSELTGQLPKSKSAWNLGVQRIIPGVGFQSWTAPAAAEPIPEGFGVLIFE